MRFEITERDGLARTGTIEIDGVRHKTPAIARLVPHGERPDGGRLWLSSPQGHPVEGDLKVLPSSFSDPDEHAPIDGGLDPGFRGSPYAPDEVRGEVAVIGDIARLILDSRRFVDRVVETKSGRELMKPVFCPVAGLPHRMALLAYCGVDLFDPVPIIMASEAGSYLTEAGPLDYSSVKDLPCSCEACRSGEREKENLLRHNYAAAEAELRLIAHRISEGRLREMVETRVRTDPWLVQNLRLMDMKAYGLQEMHAPVRGTAFHAGSKESLLRPDIVRWQRRLRERYRRPEGASVLLLIPCSAKKPYSSSQSHMRFREEVFSSGMASSVHEVIVTSPLGIVPRELELFFPAKDYDIPVTGHWDRDEQRLVQEMVSWLIETQGYEIVISHLGDEREALTDVLGDHTDTSHGEPGSRASLDRLGEALRGLSGQTVAKGRSERTHEDLRSLCRFQFGPSGEAMCDGADVAGRWPFSKIVKDGEQLGMLTPDRGMLSLTLAGADVLARSRSYCVEIEDFRPKGNLFAVGVEDASPEIRIGDDVAVVHKGDTRAVGVARMCADELRIAERGEAVHIRHVR